MTTLVLVWYASAWATLAVFARDYGRIATCTILFAVLAGPAAFGAWIASVSYGMNLCRTLWKAKL